MNNKIYFFIISILINSITSAMEIPNKKIQSPQIITEENGSPTDSTAQLFGGAMLILKGLNEGLTRLQALHEQRISNLKENLTKLKEEKNKSIQENPPKSSNNFNYRHFLKMLSIASISFIAGYLMGTKSLTFSKFPWIRYTV